MDFTKLAILILIQLIQTSYQVNDHPEAINSLLDKLIKVTESGFGNNKTTVPKEKNTKNLDDSKIVYFKTQMTSDMLFKSNKTHKNPEEKKSLENERTNTEPLNQEDDAEKDYSEIELKPSLRRTFDESRSEEIIEEIIEETTADDNENDDDVIYEKEITYDITENRKNNPKPIYKLSSLIDAVTRSGSGDEEDVIDEIADMAESESTNTHDPRSKGPNISKADAKKVLSMYNILNDFDKDNKEIRSIPNLLNLFSNLRFKPGSHNGTNQQSQLKHDESFNRHGITESGFENLFGQIVNHKKLKSILESLKLDEPHQPKKPMEHVFPELDIKKLKDNLKILDEWDKRYNIFHKSDPQLQNNTEFMQQPIFNKAQPHKEYDIYRNGFIETENSNRDLDLTQNIYQPEPKVHIIPPPTIPQFIPPLSNLGFIFPTKNKIKCCTNTNVVGNPLLGILPTERLSLINSVNRMTSGFVYNPLYYPY